MSEDRDPGEGEEPFDSFDASDPVQVKARKRKSRLRERQVTEFLGRTLQDPIGRQFLWEVLSAFHVFDQRFGVAGMGNCTEATWLYLGEREAGLQLLKIFMGRQPALVARMIAENTENG